jgi:excisionase family DNA binding protein
LWQHFEEKTPVETTISKAGRLVLLLRLRDAGVLEDQTLQAIGGVLGVNRSTILRDLLVLDQVEEEYRRMMAEQPWLRRELTVTEFACEIGASPETVRAMIRDGLVKAHKRPARGQGGRWCIPLAEVDRFRRGDDGDD